MVWTGFHAKVENKGSVQLPSNMDFDVGFEILENNLVAAAKVTNVWVGTRDLGECQPTSGLRDSCVFYTCADNHDSFKNAVINSGSTGLVNLNVKITGNEVRQCECKTTTMNGTSFECLKKPGGYWDVRAGYTAVSAVARFNFTAKRDHCRNLDGGSWRMVRHAPPGTKWHTADDSLVGTSVYGPSSGSPFDTQAWSKKFDDSHFTEFLFATGDCQHWLIATKESVIGAWYTSDVKRPVKNSSLSDEPHEVAWLRRQGEKEDPWISTTDHDVSSGIETAADGIVGEVLYLENAASGCTYIRQVQCHQQPVNRLMTEQECRDYQQALGLELYSPFKSSWSTDGPGCASNGIKVAFNTATTNPEKTSWPSVCRRCNATLQNHDGVNVYIRR